MTEERHVSCIEASDSPCTPETCEELICWVCEEPDPSWPCPSRRAQDAEAAIARVWDVCDLWQRRHDTSIRHPTAIAAIPITAVLRALNGDSDE